VRKASFSHLLENPCDLKTVNVDKHKKNTIMESLHYLQRLSVSISIGDGPVDAKSTESTYFLKHYTSRRRVYIFDYCNPQLNVSIIYDMTNK